MTDSDDIEPALSAEDAQVLELRLSAQRPVPAPGFRGALGRMLAASDPGYGPRPEHLRRTVALWAGAGTVLVILGGLQAAGAL